MTSDMAEPRPARLAGLWIGGRLSWLEQLCITSFLDHGHSLTVYSYDGVTGVPAGATVADARRILPDAEVFHHRATGSSALHSDLFRYRLLAATGEVWVDFDMLCLRPWVFPGGHVFGWEKPGRLICGAALGLPADSPTLAALLAFCADTAPVPPWFAEADRARLEEARDRGQPVHVADLPWGVWGPAALTHFLRATGEITHALPQGAFYPISFRDRRQLLKPGRDLSDRIGTDTFGVHLWNRRLSRRLVEAHGGLPPEGSFLHGALLRHGIDPAAAPIPDRPGPATPPEATAPPRRVRLPKMPKPPRTGQAAPAPDAMPDLPDAPAARFLAADRVQADPPAALAILPLRRPPPGEAAERAEALERHLDATGCWLAPPAGALPDRPQVIAVTTMKNEAPFILEWIAYNRVIGIDHALVYTNDCSDPTVPMLDRLAALGHATRLDNPFDPAGTVKPQHAALKDAMRQKVVRQADWIAVIDVDEFLAIHVGDGTVSDLLRAANHPNALSFTWRFFGNGGVADYVDRPVIEQFTRCAPEVIPNAGVAWGFKTMFHRSETRFRKLGVHRPLKITLGREDRVRWVNGSGRVMPARLIENGWRTVGNIFGYRLASLNHYALRSADSYLVKRDRGRVNHTEEDQGLYYWQRRNYIADTDDRMAWILPRVEEELARLKSDPALADLHAQAVDWHRARIARLKAEPDYARLHADLLRTARIDASDFLTDIRPQDEPALQRVETRPRPVP